MTPITDFETVYPKDDDIGSQIDVFNEDNIRRQVKERLESIKKTIEEVKRTEANRPAGPRIITQSLEEGD